MILFVQQNSKKIKRVRVETTLVQRIVKRRYNLAPTKWRKILIEPKIRVAFYWSYPIFMKSAAAFNFYATRTFSAYVPRKATFFEFDLIYTFRTTPTPMLQALIRAAFFSGTVVPVFGLRPCFLGFRSDISSLFIEFWGVKNCGNGVDVTDDKIGLNIVGFLGPGWVYLGPFRNVTSIDEFQNTVLIHILG